MRPKGKLFALFAVFAAIGLVTASGAFTTVQADRTAEVNVASDSNALLVLEPNSSSPNDAYARSQGNQLQVVLNSSNGPSAGGTGINENAITELDHVFNVTNQGTQTVDVSASISVDGGSNINTDTSSSPTIYLYDGSNTATSINNGNSINVPTGETGSVGIYIDSKGLDKSETLDLTITINANATA